MLKYKIPQIVTLTPDYPVGGILLRTIEDRSRFLD